MMNTEQLYLLKLSEECLEVAKVCSKAIQFGLDNTNPKERKTNAVLLNEELNDIQASVEMLQDRGFTYKVDRKAIQRKKAKVINYREYSRELGKVG